VMVRKSLFPFKGKGFMRSATEKGGQSLRVSQAHNLTPSYVKKLTLKYGVRICKFIIPATTRGFNTHLTGAQLSTSMGIQFNTRLADTQASPPLRYIKFDVFDRGPKR
jgi:hypothetical protein